MQIVHTITESGAQSNQLFNAAHVYSSLNRKMMPPVSADGIAQNFALRVQVYSDAANTVTLETASNSYVTKQAVKSWYRAWRKVLRENSVTLKDLGPYGKWFKPRLEATEDILGSADEAGRGEWNYTDMVVPAAAAGGGNNVTGGNLADQYSLHLVGSSSSQATNPNQLWTSVGMIESWLGSRRSTFEAGSSVDSSEIFDDNNPLRQAMGRGVESEILGDEVRDLQADLPPYTNEDLDGLYTQALIKTNADLASHADIVAPCGLVRVTTTAACTLVFTLVGIGDM